jgi:hypothetical protein
MHKHVYSSTQKQLAYYNHDTNTGFEATQGYQHFNLHQKHKMGKGMELVCNFTVFI